MTAPTLALAERVAAKFTARGAPCAVIGAWAMVAHRYTRPTSDFDLAVAVELPVLQAVGDELRAEGLDVDLTEPDAADPLGGTLRVRRPGADLVDVVNYVNSRSALGSELTGVARSALTSAMPLLVATSLPVVDLPHLVALKLTAWDGTPAGKPISDIRELLRANPNTDLRTIEALCESLGWGGHWRRMLSFL